MSKQKVIINNPEKKINEDFYCIFIKVFIENRQTDIENTIIYKNENNDEVFPESSLMPFIIAN